eukprot:14224684-Alexandrium_andersonii.AAC.1
MAALKTKSSPGLAPLRKDAAMRAVPMSIALRRMLRDDAKTSLLRRDEGARPWLWHVAQRRCEELSIRVAQRQRAGFGRAQGRGKLLR